MGDGLKRVVAATKATRKAKPKPARAWDCNCYDCGANYMRQEGQALDCPNCGSGNVSAYEVTR